MLAQWETKQLIIFCIPFGLIVLGALVWLLVRKTIRTRFEMARQFREDPDINEWLIVFNWSRKTLYVPTIIASLAAFVIMLFEPSSRCTHAVGGVWMTIFIVNFLIDEYELNIKALLIGLLFLLAAGMWLSFLNWLSPVVDWVGHLQLEINGVVYLLIALVFSLAVATSWLKGLFYYVAITPNYCNLQSGPTETSEQLSREGYSTRIDTGDFLERLLGFGRIMITFTDSRRQPMQFLVAGVGKKAAALESLRGIFAVETQHKDRGVEPQTPSPEK